MSHRSTNSSLRSFLKTLAVVSAGGLVGLLSGVVALVLLAPAVGDENPGAAFMLVAVGGCGAMLGAILATGWLSWREKRQNNPVRER